MADDDTAEQPLDERPQSEVSPENEVPPENEPRKAFLVRGAIVVAVLAAGTAVGVWLTSRSDESTARDLCAKAGLASVTAADRTADDTFVVQGTSAGHAATCRVTRDPQTDKWEVESVA